MKQIPQALKDFVLCNKKQAIIALEGGTLIAANDAAAKLFGYKSASEAIGLPLEKIMTPESIRIAKNRTACRLAGNPPLNSQVYDCIGKDGQIIKVEVSTMAWPADSVVTISHIRDVTERERTTEETAKWYRVFTENATDVIWRSNLDKIFTYVSPSIRKTGYEPEEWVGRSLKDFLPPEDFDVIQKSSENDPDRVSFPKRFEARIKCKDGTLVWREILVDAVREDGKVVAVQGVSRDISERKKVEDALKFTQFSIDHAAEAAYWVKPGGQIVYANNTACCAIGYTQEELLSMSILDIDIGALPVRVGFWDRLKEHGSIKFETVYRTKAGGEFPVEVTASYLNYDNEDYVCAFARDISQHKKTEATLRKAHDDMRKAYELQREFLNNVTHEVRTPLTAIQGYANMFLEGLAGPISTEQTSLLRKIVTCSKDLLEIVGGVLDIARFKSGAVGLRLKACKPSDILCKALNSILPQAKEKGINVITERSERESVGFYDEEKLITILTNLLSNAVKFTSQGEIQILIESDDCGMEIVIIDTGMGIKQGDLRHIFDEFSQLDCPGRYKPTGFGIGLAIVSAAVDSIGARLTVSSKEAIGTAFTLYVPVLDDDPPPSTPKA